MLKRSEKEPMKLEDLDGLSIRASDAFLAMGKFLDAYFQRTHGTGDLATICSDVEIEEDRMSSDPAALADWLEGLHAVLDER